MECGEISIRDGLYKAQVDNTLVVFAGAGVSAGHPASLPNFRRLLELTFDELPIESLRPGRGEIDIPAHFQVLEDRYGDEVKKFVKRTYSQPCMPNDLHLLIPTLFARGQEVRIVTTNYDSLLSPCVLLHTGTRPTVDAYPNLPILPEGPPTGITHLHGSAENAAQDLLLTTKDYGKAYMCFEKRPAYAFLTNVLSRSTVLFVGYSLNDPIMRHLLAGQNKKAYAFCRNSEISRWHDAGVEPLAYHYDAVVKDSPLIETVRAWGEKIQGKAITPQELRRQLEGAVDIASGEGLL